MPLSGPARRVFAEGFAPAITEPALLGWHARPTSSRGGGGNDNTRSLAFALHRYDVVAMASLLRASAGPEAGWHAGMRAV